VGDRLVETCLDITSHLVEASYRRDKHAELSAASRALVRARVLVRLARTVHCVSEAQHLYFVTESDELGRMRPNLRAGYRNHNTPDEPQQQHRCALREDRRNSCLRGVQSRRDRVVDPARAVHVVSVARSWECCRTRSKAESSWSERPPDRSDQSAIIRSQSI